ncbi:PAS domain-containing protein [Roseovarius aestuarii]|uniref:PAS domain-containing protein n=1 Tax=Roseovarius aestuarii TaxID=475083 RepID=UPI001593A62D|nr:PAS domain-containing protein [Roseovarius aestuarii]
MKNPLAYKLLVGVLICSTLLSAAATTVQLYVAFQRQDAFLREIPGEIESGFGQSLSIALWSFDETQINKLMDGIQARSDISYLRLSNDTGRVWVRGPSDPHEKLQSDTINFLHPDPLKGEKTVGTLELGLSRAHIWSGLYAQVLVVFLSNVVKTGLASIAILLIFRQLVSRHLQTISSFVSNPNWLNHASELSLERSSNHTPDDLDAITTALISTRRELDDVNQDLRSASEQLRAVLDATANGIIGLDRDGRVAVINPAARHMLGGKSEETPFEWPQAIKFLDITDLNPLDASSDPVNRALAGQALINETHLMTREGEDQNRYVRVSSAKVDDPSTDLRCVVALDDVSLLEKNRQQAERKSRLDALGQLTGGIAHDFNCLSPLELCHYLCVTGGMGDGSEAVFG